MKEFEIDSEKTQRQLAIVAGKKAAKQFEKSLTRPKDGVKTRDNEKPEENIIFSSIDIILGDDGPGFAVHGDIRAMATLDMQSGGSFSGEYGDKLNNFLTGKEARELIKLLSEHIFKYFG